MVFASKKGMSPLIATVLLIAFAVALGAMIMNWSAGVAPEEEGVLPGCAQISLTSKDGICIDGTRLMFDLTNNGKKEINAVRMVISDDYGGGSFDLQESNIIPGETVESQRPYAHEGGLFAAELVPLIFNAEGKLAECKGKGYTQSTLPTC